MNAEQTKEAARWVVGTLGGWVGGYGIAKGWFNAEQVGRFMTNETVLTIVGALITSGATLALGMWNRTKSNNVAIVNAMDEVAGVITTNTKEGNALANAVPSATVTPAGTSSAKEVAKAV